MCPIHPKELAGLHIVDDLDTDAINQHVFRLDSGQILAVTAEMDVVPRITYQVTDPGEDITEWGGWDRPMKDTRQKNM